MKNALQAYLDDSLMTMEDLIRRTHPKKNLRLSKNTIYKALRNEPIREKSAVQIVHATRGVVPLSEITIYKAWTKDDFDGA